MPIPELTVNRANGVLEIRTDNEAQADQVWIEREAWLRRFPAQTLRLIWTDAEDPQCQAVIEFSPQMSSELQPIG
jgi:hypothetical protein